MLEARARRHWSRTKFYRRLGSMLFGAARGHQRWRVFERFYRLDEGLVERFYAARSTRGDKLRIVCGKPPVPMGRALGALTSSRPQLMEAA
jgi:lycopene beta-cyclase